MRVLSNLGNFLAVAVSSLSLSGTLFASDHPPNEGSAGEFRAVLLMTTDSALALENWSKPTQGVYIPSTNMATRGQPIEALVLFTGCASNEKGNCDAEVDYRIIAPDGSLYAEYLNTELWKNRPAIPHGEMGLAVDRVGLVVEPDEALGRYAVTCVVRDVVAGVEFEISSEFSITETDPG